MRYVICYDISDDRRRDRVASALLDFGTRIQESVFLATVDEALRDRMIERVTKEIDAAVDSVIVFGLCRGCAARVELMGAAHLPEDQEYYVV